MDVSPLVAAHAQLPVHAAPVEPVAPIAPTAKSDKGAATDSSTSEQQKGSAGESSIDKALKALNDEMQAWSTQLKFSVDPDLHRVVVTVVDPNSGKTLKTIPSEAVLRIAKMLTKLEGKAVKTEA